MHFELERAYGMGNAFNVIGLPVRKIVCRVDTPRVSRAMMLGALYAIEHGIAHVHIRRRHINLRPQHLFAVGKLPIAHALKEVEIFFDRTLPPGAFHAGFRRRSARRRDFFRAHVAHVCLALLNQQHGPLVQLLEIIRCVIWRVVPLEPKPAYVFHYGIDIFDILLFRICIVEAKVAFAAIFFRNAEIKAYRLRMADMKIPVRLRGKARMHPAFVLSLFQIFFDYLFDKIERSGGFFIFHNVPAGIVKFHCAC